MFRVFLLRVVRFGFQVAGYRIVLKDERWASNLQRRMKTSIQYRTGNTYLRFLSAVFIWYLVKVRLILLLFRARNGNIDLWEKQYGWIRRSHSTPPRPMMRLITKDFRVSSALRRSSSCARLIFSPWLDRSMKTEKDYEEFLELLNKHDVRYCIIGS